MRVAAALLAVTACGRFHFDDLSDGRASDGTTSGSDGTGTSTIVFVQMSENSAVGNSFAIPIVATTAGDLVVVNAGTNIGDSIVSVTDNAGNSYVSANAIAADPPSGRGDMWYARNVTAGATIVTVLAMAGPAAATVVEFSGVDPISPVDTALGSTSQPATLTPTSPSITTTVPGELIVATADVEFTVTGLHAGSPFTSEMIGSDTDGLAHLIAPTIGTYSAVWDQNGLGTYGANAVSFKPR